MIKVCIIEDEPGIRKLLRMIIEKQDGFFVVAECGDFASAVSDFMKYKPDVVLVDILVRENIQEKNGLTLLV